MRRIVSGVGLLGAAAGCWVWLLPTTGTQTSANLAAVVAGALAGLGVFLVIRGLLVPEPS